MAISYYELAKTNDDIIWPGGTLIFDQVVSSEGSQIYYDPATGIIGFLDPGYYYIDWFVAPQFGLTTDGSNWAIQTLMSGLSFVGSSHTRVSVTTGFAIIHAEESGEEARLVNVSSNSLTLSKVVQNKAGLIVYSIAVMNFAP